MIFMIWFVTCFGIDFRWVWASYLVPFWHPFGIKYNVVLQSFFWWFWGLYFYWFWFKKKRPKSRGSGSLVRHFVDQRMFWDVILATYWLHLLCFRYLFGSILGTLSHFLHIFLTADWLMIVRWRFNQLFTTLYFEGNFKNQWSNDTSK